MTNEGIMLERLYLFGSRSRDNYTRFSDYDVLIIVKADIVIDSKKRITKLLRTTFAEKDIDIDVIIKSINQVEKSKHRSGSIVKQALKEGVLF